MNEVDVEKDDSNNKTNTKKETNDNHHTQHSINSTHYSTIM